MKTLSITECTGSVKLERKTLLGPSVLWVCVDLPFQNHGFT